MKWIICWHDFKELFEHFDSPKLSAVKELLKAMRAENITKLEFRYPSDDGTPRYVLDVSGNLYRGNGSLKCTLEDAEDILAVIVKCKVVGRLTQDVSWALNGCIIEGGGKVLAR